MRRLNPTIIKNFATSEKRNLMILMIVMMIAIITTIAMVTN